VPEQALDSETGSAQAQDWVPGRDSEMAQEMGLATAKEPVQDQGLVLALDLVMAVDLAWVLAQEMGLAQDSEPAQWTEQDLAMGLEPEVAECLCPAKFQEHAGQTMGLPLVLGM
jgi:hypothetical protein